MQSQLRYKQQVPHMPISRRLNQRCSSFHRYKSPAITEGATWTPLHAALCLADSQGAQRLARAVTALVLVAPVAADVCKRDNQQAQGAVGTGVCYTDACMGLTAGVTAL